MRWPRSMSMLVGSAGRGADVVVGNPMAASRPRAVATTWEGTSPIGTITAGPTPRAAADPSRRAVSWHPAASARRATSTASGPLAAARRREEEARTPSSSAVRRASERGVVARRPLDVAGSLGADLRGERACAW